MQYRQLPPGGGLADIEAVWRAVPRSPEEVLETIPEPTRRRIRRSGAGVTYVSCLLEWAVVFGRIQKTAAGYVRPDEA